MLLRLRYLPRSELISFTKDHFVLSYVIVNSLPSTYPCVEGAIKGPGIDIEFFKGPLSQTAALMLSLLAL